MGKSKKQTYTEFINSKFIEFLKENKKMLILCLIATLVWGLITHSYGFLHSSFSHDSLNEFNANVFGNDWRIQLGRIFVPLYRFVVRDSITMPWLIGVLSLIYISMTVFLIVKLFNVRSKILTILISGIFTTNITVIATASTYIHDLDCNMLALTLAVLSVYLWQKYDKGFLYGMIPLCLSIGIYQSFISVSITLIIIYLIMKLFEGEKFKKIFYQGFKSIVMIIGAGLLFFIAMKFICYITGISIKSGNYNSIDTILSMPILEIIHTTIAGYIRTCYKILNVTSVYPSIIFFAIHLMLIVILGTIIIYRLSKKEIKIKEKILTLILIIILPISMNIVYPLTGGISHDLMEFGFWLIYLLALLVSWWVVEHFNKMKPIIKYGQRFVSVCLILIVLWSNVQTANAVYLKKDLEQKANLSLFTRIVYRMEEQDGYITGKTPVVFVGRPDTLLDTIPGYERISSITGCWNEFALNSSSRDRYRSYFDYILLNPAIMAEQEKWDQMQNDTRVNDMPSYPKEGSIAFVDDILVIKMGE